MVYLGFEPGTTGWKPQMNPLSYGCPLLGINSLFDIFSHFTVAANFLLFSRLLNNINYSQVNVLLAGYICIAKGY